MHLGWQEAGLTRRRKNDPGKLAIAARLRRETHLAGEVDCGTRADWDFQRRPGRAISSGERHEQHPSSQDDVGPTRDQI